MSMEEDMREVLKDQEQQIKLTSGKPDRTKRISDDEITDLIIALETTDVDGFLKLIK